MANAQGRVAEVIRVSTLAQAGEDRFGIPAQRAENSQTVKHNGLQLVRSFQIKGVSGADMLDDPNTQELIRMMDAGMLDGVVCREFSRLMRPDDYGDWAILKAFQRNNVVLYLPSGPLDLNDKNGRFLATNLAAMAAYERAMIRERTMSGKKQAMKEGRKVASRLSYGVGYDKDAKRWFYTENAQRVVEAFKMVLAGRSLWDIAQHLGVTPTGAKAILNNEIYVGWVVYGKNPQRRRILGGETVRKQVISEPLISRETFNYARKILETTRATHKKRCVKGWAKYNGFLFCDRCGTLLTPWRGKIRGKVYCYYVCRRRLREHPHFGECDLPRLSYETTERTLDHFVSEQLTSHAFAARLAVELENRNKNPHDKRAARIGQLQKQQRSLGAKRDKILESFYDGDITRGEKTARIAQVTERLASLSSELGVEQSAELPMMQTKQIEAMFGVLSDWEFLEREEARRLLSVTIPRFRVDGAGRIVSFYWLLDSKELTIPQQSQAVTGLISREARGDGVHP
jgi:site-specific DNA recombinase